MVGGGKRRREHHYGASIIEARRKKSEQQQRAYEARLRRERWTGGTADEEINGRSSFYHYYQRWLRHGRERWSPATVDGRVAHYRRNLHDTFGAVRVCDLHPHMIEDWFRAQLDAGRPYASVDYAFGCIRAMLKVAVAKRHIEWNPATVVDLPDRPPRIERRDVLHVEEYQRLVAACRSDQERLFVRLAGEAALRRGEVCALRVSYLNLDASELHVAKTCIKPDGKPQIEKLPKNGKPRWVALTSGVRDLLIAHVAAHGLEGDDLLFATREGLPFNPSTCRERVKAAMVRAGLTNEKDRAAFTLHDLRRTAATLARERSVPFDVVQSQLGHGRQTITDQHYLRNRCNPRLHEFSAALEGILDEPVE